MYSYSQDMPGKKKPELPPEALQLVAQRFRVLSDPTRLGVLQALFGGELTVQQICTATGTTQANASKHLSQLTRAGILGRRKQGSFVYYRIVDPSIYQLCELVCGALADRFAAAGAALTPSG